MNEHNEQAIEQGEPISYGDDGKICVPDHPIILYIEGDGVGTDITPVMLSVVDTAVEKAYQGRRKIMWHEIYAGAKAAEQEDGIYLPQKTLDMIRQYSIAIKGPLTTPVGGGQRSLNVTLRQKLDLYVCLRPVRWFEGVPTPIKSPQDTNMVIFRENSEDIYAGIEWPADSEEANKFIHFLRHDMAVSTIRFPENCGIGVKPVSCEGSKRLVRSAIEYAIEQNSDSVTLVHKGNIMKFTEGAFREWGYEVARDEFGATPLGDGGWMKIVNPHTQKEITVKDVIVDAMLQQIILRPTEYDVIATLNLNGDLISDALAAQVGGLGLAPGANVSDRLAVFEATHGTAPKYAGQDKVNPSSLVLSAEMMLRHLGWREAAELVIHGMEAAIANKTVTYDLHRLMDNATCVSCSEFGKKIIAEM